MAFTKHTGSDQPLKEAKIVKAENIKEAKSLVKEGSASLIDEVERIEDEDEEESQSE